MGNIAPLTSVPASVPGFNAPDRAAAVEAAKEKNLANVKTAAKNFEAMYMQEMFAHMWDGVDTDGPFGGGKGEEVFRSMMIEQYGHMVADSGQTKIADSLTREMLRMQEEQRNPRGTIIRNQGETHE